MCSPAYKQAASLPIFSARGVFFSSPRSKKVNPFPDNSEAKMCGEGREKGPEILGSVKRAKHRSAPASGKWACMHGDGERERKKAVILIVRGLPTHIVVACTLRKP